MTRSPGGCSGAPTTPDVREALLYYLEAEELFGVSRLPVRTSLASLASGALVCTGCPLHAGRTKVVFGEGNPRADLMFVGEAPGEEEDLSGRPFVGRAGRLLTRMIESMGLDRSHVYIANTVKCRPPGNRTPDSSEIAACARFLQAQIEAVAPRVIVALGAPAARTLLGRSEGISALRGRCYPFPRDERIQIVPTFHPAYLLRNEAEKPKAWLDLQLAMRLLDQKAGRADANSPAEA